MSVLDRAVLAERAMAVERHLRRVADRLPRAAADMQPATDPSDAVILHLWQATQIVIDQAMTACLSFFSPYRMLYVIEEGTVFYERGTIYIDASGKTAKLTCDPPESDD